MKQISKNLTSKSHKKYGSNNLKIVSHQFGTQKISSSSSNFSSKNQTFLKSGKNISKLSKTTKINFTNTSPFSRLSQTSFFSSFQQRPTTPSKTNFFKLLKKNNNNFITKFSYGMKQETQSLISFSQNYSQIISKKSNIIGKNQISFGQKRNEVTFAETTEEKRIRKEKENTIQAKLRQAPTGFRFWVLFAALFIGSSTVYYVKDDDQYERNVNNTIEFLKSPDQEVCFKALTEDLEELMWDEKKLLSGVAYLPQKMDTLIEKGVIEALLSVLKDNNEQNTQIALIWLNAFLKNDQAKERIVRHGNFELVLQILENNEELYTWFAAATVLNTLLSDTEFVKNHMGEYSDSLQDILKKMEIRDHPLCSLISERISILLNDAGVISGDFQTRQDFDSSPSGVALLASQNSVVPPKSDPESSFFGNLQYHLSRAIGFGFLASFWGKMRWTLNGLYNGLGFSKTNKYFKLKSRTGLSVFGLLSMDILTEAAMIWPKEGIDVSKYVSGLSTISETSDYIIKIPQEILGYSMTTAAPVIESFLLSTVGLALLRVQKYIVLPMALASVHAHQEFFIENFEETRNILPESVGGKGMGLNLGERIRKALPSIPYINEKDEGKEETKKSSELSEDLKN